MAIPLLSLTGKRWLEPDVQTSAANVIIRLLQERNLGGEEVLPDPWLLADMERAVNRIRKAVDQNESVAIFGDYDCDGVTATAQLVRYFRRHGCEPVVRLPHRVRDGYGMNLKIVEEFIAAKINLLITVDTGISSAQEIEALTSAGIDVIVTDHHNLPPELPTATALLHPTLSSNYPEPFPSGAGVAFQLLRALEGGEWAGMETDCALAMIGTIADVVELRGPNRALVQSGLLCLPHVEGQLFELMELAGLKAGAATSTDIAFRLAPRLNASGRMDDPLLSLDALLHGGDAIAQLDALNTKRQLETDKSLKKALKEMEKNDPLAPLVTAIDATYGHGIIGLIAGRLTEQTGRPSMVATVDDDICIVSLRSPPSYHIAEGLNRHQDLLLRFGGHAQAAGCSLRLEHWEALCERLANDVAQNAKAEDLFPTLVIDGALQAFDITLGLIRDISRLEPFGQGNREPLFMMKNVKVESLRAVGRDSSHLQCRIAGMKAVGFGLGKLPDLSNELLDVVCRLGIDTWNGTMQPQLFLVDVRFSDAAKNQRHHTKTIVSAA